MCATLFPVYGDGRFVWSPPANANAEAIEYDIRWGGMSVGTAIISNAYFSGGNTGWVVRSMQAKSHGFVSLLRRVDNRIASERMDVDDRVVSYRVSKQIREGWFRQDDDLHIDPQSGTAWWVDHHNRVEARYEIPPDVSDYVTMLFDIRRHGRKALNEPVAYRLAMDDDVHAFEIMMVGTGRVKTAFGWMDAHQLRVVSHSTNLFKRNVPGAMWVCPESSMILSMEARTILGNVRSVLSRWEVNGEDVTGRLLVPVVEE